MSAARELDPSLGEAAELLEEAEIRVQEAVRSLASYRDRLEPDPQRLEWVESRLAKIRGLARRYKVEETELGGRLDRVRSRIAEFDSASHSWKPPATRSNGRKRLLRGGGGTQRCARRERGVSGRSGFGANEGARTANGRFRVAVDAAPPRKSDAAGAATGSSSRCP